MSCMPRIDSQAYASAYATARKLHVTAGNQHENAVVSNTTQLDHLFALCPDLLAVVSSQTHTWLRVNPAFTTMLGFAEVDLLGAWFFDIVHPEDRERSKTVEAALRTGQKLVNFEHRAVCKQGGYRWISWQLVASASYGSLFCVGRNVTLERHTLHSVRALNSHLQQANAELEEFVNTAGHDLQEPLRTVSTYSELLMRRYGHELPAGSTELVSTIVAANRRMHALLHGLLEYARLSQQPNALIDPAETVSLGTIFDQVLESLKSAIAESSATITHDALPEVQGNRTQLARLLQNLFSNSIKYRREDAPLHIHLGVQKQEAEWQFCVTDNGSGFNPEHADRIFGAFKRLHGCEIPGTGLGLPICRRIVEHHGGRIWAEGRPGEGATFFFTLPNRSIG